MSLNDIVCSVIVKSLTGDSSLTGTVTETFPNFPENDFTIFFITFCCFMISLVADAKARSCFEETLVTSQSFTSGIGIGAIGNNKSVNVVSL